MEVDSLLSSLHARFFESIRFSNSFPSPLRRRLHPIDDELDTAAAQDDLLVVVGRRARGRHRPSASGGGWPPWLLL